MHIAHKAHPLLTVNEVAKLAGVKRRQVAYLARAGEIPGARLSADKYHFEYADTPALRVWAKNKRRLAKERLMIFRSPRPYDRFYYPKGDSDLKLPRRIARAFTNWKLWMYQHRPFHGWPEYKLQALKRELETFDEASEKLEKLLAYYSNERLREKVSRL